MIQETILAPLSPRTAFMPRLAALLAALVLIQPAPGQSKKDAPPKAAKGKARDKGAVPGYKKATIHGFTLMIHEDVYKNNDDSRWKRKPLEVLELELGTIVRRLP